MLAQQSVCEATIYDEESMVRIALRATLKVPFESPGTAAPSPNLAVSPVRLKDNYRL